MEVLLWLDKSEKAVLARLDRHYRDAMKDIEMKISSMLGRNDANLPHVIRRIEYQRMLKEQIKTVLERLHSNEYETISQYLTDSYTDAFVGTMYTLHQQDVPLILPIDQSVVMKAVTLDSKLKESLYTTMGKDMTALKKTVAEEVTRGIATGQMYSEIARNIRYAAGIPLRRAKTIARTEASRVQEQATFDAATEAKASGADVVKQWSSRRDGQTRDTHRMLDGQVREVDEPFTVNGKKAMHPHGFGVAELDINCRCTMLTRARAALDEDTLKKLEERAQKHGTVAKDKQKVELAQTENIAEFKKKYLKAAEEVAEAENNVDEDEEFDIFSFLEENDGELFETEEVKPVEYPQELLLTAKEKKLMEGIDAYYADPNLAPSKQPENYVIPSDYVRMALHGQLSEETLRLRRVQLEKKLADAEEMIQQRKSEGYKFDKDAAIARRELNREIAKEEGRLVVGKDGIRYWQNSRKQAIESLEELEFAEKLQRRFEFTKDAETLENARKSGIINTKQTTRKIKDGTTVVNPMDASKYAKLKSNLQKKGVTVMQAKGDDLAYVQAIGAEATYGGGYIMHIGEIPSASGLYEEIIHWTQSVKYGELTSTDPVELCAREVAANRKLLKNGYAYGFDDVDFEDIQRNLATWESKFEELVGVTYDESDYRRDV